MPSPYTAKYHSVMYRVQIKDYDAVVRAIRDGNSMISDEHEPFSIPTPRQYAADAVVALNVYLGKYFGNVLKIHPLANALDIYAVFCAESNANNPANEIPDADFFEFERGLEKLVLRNRGNVLFVEEVYRW